MIAKFNNTGLGSWALITGASSGIGKEFARQLAANNFNVVLNSRRPDVLDTLGKELQSKFGISYKVVAADLSQQQGIEEVIKSTRGLDIGLVVSNAGTGDPGEFVKKKMDELLKMINTSVLSHLKITHHFSKIFAKQKRGGIILVSAMGARDGLPFMSNDAGTRAYIRSLGLGLHTELKRYNVNVTVLETTPTETPIVSELGFKADKMPMKLISTEQCVKETLIALKKQQSVILPGRKFRIMSRLIPSSFMRKMNGKMLAEGNGIKWEQ